MKLNRESELISTYVYRMSIYELPWSILSTHLTGVITVTEEEIIAAMKLVGETYACLLIRMS